MRGKYILEKISYELEMAIDEVIDIKSEASVSFSLLSKISRLHLRLASLNEHVNAKLEEITE